MKVAVTGASGKIGSEVVRQLRERGHEPLSLDIRPPEDASIPHRVLDLRVPSQLRKAFDGMDGVCHLGEWPNLFVGPAETFSNNTEIGSTVMQTARQVGVGRFIYTSTCQIYGYWGDNLDLPNLPVPPLPMTEETPLMPMNGYALSKVANEAFAKLMVAQGPMPIAAFRFPFVMNRKHAEWCARDPKWRQRSAPDGFGTYVHVEDAALGYCLALEQGWEGFEAFHFVADDLMYGGDIGNYLRGIWPNVVVPPGLVVSTAKAQQRLGWKAQRSVWHDTADVRVKLAQSA